MTLINDYINPFKFEDLDLSNVEPSQEADYDPLWGTFNNLELPKDPVPIGQWFADQPSHVKDLLLSNRFISPLNPPRHTEWLVDRLIPKRGIGMIYGDSGCGKTLIATSLAVHLSTYKPSWCGRVLENTEIFDGGSGHLVVEKLAPSTVVYLAYEDPEGAMSRVYGQLNYLGHAGVDRKLLEVGPCDVPLSDADFVVRLARGIKAHNPSPSLVIIDTLTLMAGDIDENSSTLGSILVNKLKAVGRELGNPTFLLIHHSTKADASKIRGSSSLKANMDFVLCCESFKGKGISKGVTMKEVKQKNGPGDGQFEFAIQPFQISRFAELQDQTTAIALPIRKGTRQGQSGGKHGGQASSNEAQGTSGKAGKEEAEVVSQPDEQNSKPPRNKTAELFSEVLCQHGKPSACGQFLNLEDAQAIKLLEVRLEQNGLTKKSASPRVHSYKSKPPKALVDRLVTYDAAEKVFRIPVSITSPSPTA